MQLYTIGYQGLTLWQLGMALKRVGVDLVIDIREAPWSRLIEFRRAAIEETLELLGIGYLHLKSAGNPKKLREMGGTTEESLERYRQHLELHPDLRHRILETMETAFRINRAPCLLCLERDPYRCHRTPLIEFLGQHFPSLVVTHLLPDSSIDEIEPPQRK